ncbi:MAG: hypothetical protein ACYS5V_16670, partial [Planctomycetota bacterium]
MFCSAMRHSRYWSGWFSANGEGGVFDVAVEGHHAVVGAQGVQGHAVGAPGGELAGLDRIAQPQGGGGLGERPRRQGRARRTLRRRRGVQLGRAPLLALGHAQLGGLGVQVGHGLVDLVDGQRLAVIRVLLELLHAPSLDRAGDDGDGLFVDGGGQGLEDLVPVVPVDDARLAPRSRQLAGQRVGRLLRRNPIAL